MNDPIRPAEPGWKALASLAAAAARLWEGRPAATLLAGTAVSAMVVGLLVASPGVPPAFHYKIGEFSAAAVRAPYDLSVPDEVATSTDARGRVAGYTPPVASVDARPHHTSCPPRIAEVFSVAPATLIARSRRPDVKCPEDEAKKLTATSRRRAAAGQGTRR